MEVWQLATTTNFIEYVYDQVREAGEVSYKKMFGEYTIYCDGKIVALACDNQLFVKPTASGRAALGDVVEAPPYPQAKPCFLIKEHLEDQQLISKVIRLTADELPEPKPKKAKIKK